jgi:hypothetical protein
MKLQNKKMAGVVLAMGKKTVAIDANGFVDVGEQHEIDALMSSGFVPVQEIEKPKVAPKVEAPKVEEPKVEAPKVDAKSEKPKFSRKK